MSESPGLEQKLEQVVGRALREIPLHPAPATLESRVFNELHRRAALPWFRRSFSHWPALARGAFIVVSGLLVGWTLLGGFSALVGPRPLNEVGAQLLFWVQPALAVLASGGAVATLLLRVIPPLWIYAAMALATVLYVLLFGLGAAAYRTLYLRPLNGR
jgi:hypothetical protein